MFTKMKTLISSCVMALALTGIAPAASLETVANSTYKLHLGPVTSPWGGVSDRFNCSAVAISPTQLVTAAHCIPRDRRLGVMIEDKNGYEILSRTFYAVTTVRTNTNDDTAFLELKTDKFRFGSYVDVAQFTPTIGHDLFAVGYPRGHELTLTPGMFTALTKLPESMGVKGDYYKTTVPVTGGSSGGGLYERQWDPLTQDWDYRLVGLTTAGWADVSFQTYFSTTEAVNRVMRHLVKYE